jgi:hypothetical protein
MLLEIIASSTNFGERLILNAKLTKEQQIKLR